MIYHYYTKDYQRLFTSLERYFRFVLNHKLTPINRKGSEDKKNICLLVWTEEKEQSEFPNIINIRQPKSVITLGVDDTCVINLLYLDELNLSLTNILNTSKGQIQPPFTREELLIKVQSFFKGHGEESLLSCLNWTMYYLSNGPKLLQANECTWDEYQTNFLRPGLNNWQIFTKRFEKYYIYLELLEFKKEVGEIKQQIMAFDQIANKFEISNETAIKALNSVTLDEWFAGLLKIDEILVNIKNTLGVVG